MKEATQREKIFSLLETAPTNRFYSWQLIKVNTPKGWITKDDYDKKLKEIKEKQYDINIQIEDHTKADESYYLTASTVLNLAKNALEERKGY